MKKNRIKSLFVIIAATLVICSPSRAAVDTVQSDEKAIAAASRAFSDAYVRGDTDVIRNLYTEDAVLLPPGGEIRGASEISLYFAPKPNRKNLSHSMTSSELKIDGNIAFDIGIWSNTWKIGDAAEQRASGKYFVVWRRGKDGRWRIEYDMWHRPSN